VNRRELLTGFLLIAAAVYGYHVGASWVFTVYFACQGVVFLVFALSLVEAFNLQPPSEAALLGTTVLDARVGPSVLSRETKVREDRTTGRRGRELEGQEEAEGLIAQLNGKGDSSRSNLKIPPPPPLRVLYANAVIFLYTLPINAFSILLLYGVTTMLLSELINSQWDDVIALSLAIIIIPSHMFWCLGNPTANWKHRKQARAQRLPLGVKLKHFVQLQILYLFLFLLFLISMYSCSATLQDYVSREVYHLTGKWLEEFIDRL